MVEPELLPNGDILVPTTQGDGSTKMVRLAPGEDQHAAWLAHLQRQRQGASRPPPPPPPATTGATQRTPSPRRRRRPWLSVTLGLLAVLAVVWSTGALDEPLSHIGLNKDPCLKNAFGATFCGDDAKSYCESLSELRKLAPNANDVCTELGY
jgi:hypothetical protein